MALLIALVALIVAGCGSSRAAAHGMAPKGPRRAESPDASRSAGADAGRMVTAGFFSSALHQRRIYVVYVPPGYAAAAARGVRFPVLYLFHSAVGSPYGMLRTQPVAAILRQEIAAGRAHPMLLVFPDGRVPGVTSDSEFANIRLGRYMDAVVETVHAVDGRWSTLTARRARMLGGLSTGGYAAANICLHHLGLCGGFESWGGYFVQTREFPFTTEPAANLRTNSPVSYVSGLRRQLRRLPTWGFAYQGIDDATPSEMVTFTGRFLRAGGHGAYAFYPGGHGWGLWRRQLPHMFRWASQHLEAPTHR